mmetsp:Transcript_5503/g.13800  ORF Transcript_5503/g.13800 Transcript_5503/m.13800 type:complete len:95 (+) Transcript_5503:3578-3862(+)
MILFLSHRLIGIHAKGLPQCRSAAIDSTSHSRVQESFLSDWTVKFFKTGTNRNPLGSLFVEKQRDDSIFFHRLIDIYAERGFPAFKKVSPLIGP